MMYGPSSEPGPEQEVVGDNDVFWLVSQLLGTLDED